MWRCHGWLGALQATHSPPRSVGRVARRDRPVACSTPLNTYEDQPQPQLISGAQTSWYGGMLVYLLRRHCMKYRVLGKTGWKVSVLGFGAAPLGATHGPFDEKDGIRAVHTAIDLGINFLD